MGEFKFEIEEYTIERAVSTAINEAIRDRLKSGSYSGNNAQKLQSMVDSAIDKAVLNNSATMQLMIEQEVLKVIVSDQFKSSVAQAVLSCASKKFSGAFDSVIIAAAKKAANSEIAANAMIDAVTKI